MLRPLESFIIKLFMAINVARQRQAKSLELRAAMSLEQFSIACTATRPSTSPLARLRSGQAVYSAGKIRILSRNPL